jgi:hypothetical protein
MQRVHGEEGGDRAAVPDRPVGRADQRVVNECGSVVRIDEPRRVAEGGPGGGGTGEQFVEFG